MINKKELGQNWLSNRAILEEIADLARYGVGLMVILMLIRKKRGLV